MKVTRFLLSVLLLGVTASLSHAQGAVSIDWQTCSSAIDRTPVAAPAQKINVSVFGQSAIHKAYDVRVTFGSPGGLRDAWRFDEAGCETGLLVMNEVDAKACPAFQQSAGLTIEKFTYDPIAGRALGLMANAYPQVASVNPAVRYLLVSFNMDLSFAVAGPSDPGATCGGLEVPMCAAITYATWLDANGNEIPWAKSKEYVTANDPNNTQNCPGVVPATAKTWGQVKSQYRN